jgi:hypothetical protein
MASMVAAIANSIAATFHISLPTRQMSSQKRHRISQSASAKNQQLTNVFGIVLKTTVL